MIKGANPQTNEPGRRGFLKLGIAGAGGIAVLALLERLSPSSDASRSSGHRMAGGPLSASEFHTLEMMAASVVGPPADALGTREARTAERIELELSRSQGPLLSDVMAALKVIEFLPLLWMGSRFTRLDGDGRLRVLQRMNDSDNDLIRSAFKGLRFFCLLFYYTDERTWKRMGYGGPWASAKFFEGGNRIVNLRPEAAAGGAK